MSFAKALSRGSLLCLVAVAVPGCAPEVNVAKHSAFVCGAGQILEEEGKDCCDSLDGTSCDEVLFEREVVEVMGEETCDGPEITSFKALLSNGKSLDNNSVHISFQIDQKVLSAKRDGIESLFFNERSLLPSRVVVDTQDLPELKCNLVITKDGQGQYSFEYEENGPTARTTELSYVIKQRALDLKK